MRALPILAMIIGLTACEIKEPKQVEVQKHQVVRVYKNRPASIHEEISPRYSAILTNGDTVSCTQNTRVGDTITYKFIEYGRK